MQNTTLRLPSPMLESLKALAADRSKSLGRNITWCEVARQELRRYLAKAAKKKD